MVEQEEGDSGITQMLSQDDVDQAALCCIEGFASVELVLAVSLLCICELVCQNVLCQCSAVGITAFTMLCSSAVQLGVLSGSAAFFVSGKPFAPDGKAKLFWQSIFVARHDIIHFLVQ